ncbi:MAG TPA: bifunctional glutamate N-acetyltransferase/amino-acid acetyltransferase ArgJ [Clostridia bacterium]|nr:bifunctional glutamate N-acetyltransferase/amino-acid acetyltransferase ArgJ [Clostridia bacterium]
MISTQQELLVPRGFQFAAVKAGIKASGRPDLALIEAPMGASAAAVFTRNRVVAAPVQVGRAHLAETQGRVRAVLVNAGNANCATGKPGLNAAQAVCAELGRLVEAAPQFIVPSSTGIIGVPLPTEKIVTALPSLLAARSEGEAALKAFSEAILTTDMRPKTASRVLKIGRKEVRVAGVAKGSGMIHPNMATMLAYILTDADATPRELTAMLRTSTDTTFNSISVDGDTSTNDTVLLLASGMSGCRLRDSGVRKKFALALQEVCASLAEQVVRDGEGAKHLVRLHVEQARTFAEARQIARAVANSALVKTAWAGCDPNWGRILSAAGTSGVELDPAKVSIYFGDQLVCRRGMAVEFDKRAAHEYLSQPEYDIRISLGRGRAKVEFLTCDLTAEYVHINADYST